MNIPVLGREASPLITRRDLVEILDRVPATSPALRRNLFALMHKLFSWAAERGDLDRSTMSTMKSPPAVSSRDRVLSDEALFFVTICAENLGEPFCALIHTLLVTGQRREEIAGMTWGELDQTLSDWSIPAVRAKNGMTGTVPLALIAVAELNALAGGERWPRTGFVFMTTGRTPASVSPRSSCGSTH